MGEPPSRRDHHGRAGGASRVRKIHRNRRLTDVRDSAVDRAFPALDPNLRRVGRFEVRPQIDDLWAPAAKALADR
jgi:hypothetical protein